MKIFLFDMGLPMIMPSIVLMAVALIPIILLETYFVGKNLQVDAKKVITPVAVANVVSTFLGIPVTWILLVVLEFASVSAIGAITDRNPWSELFSVTLGAPWVAPRGHNEDWVVIGAMLFLLVPYGLASWAIEYFVIKAVFAKKLDVSAPPKDLRRAVGKANLISYLLLAVFVIVFWGITLSGSH